MIIIIMIIIIMMIKITKMIKCKSIYRTPTTTNTELLLTLHNDGKPLCNIKVICESSIYASEMAYPSLHVMNRGRPYRLNSLLGTLPHLISQE